MSSSSVDLDKNRNSFLVKRDGGWIVFVARVCVTITALLSAYGVIGGMVIDDNGLLIMYPNAGSEATELGDRAMTLVYFLTFIMRCSWIFNPRNKVAFGVALSTYPAMLVLFWSEIFVYNHVSFWARHMIFFNIYVPTVIVLLLLSYSRINFEGSSQQQKTERASNKSM